MLNLNQPAGLDVQDFLHMITQRSHRSMVNQKAEASALTRRLAVVMRLGAKKGDLSGAIQEAVVEWLREDPKFRDSP